RPDPRENDDDRRPDDRDTGRGGEALGGHIQWEGMGVGERKSFPGGVSRSGLPRPDRLHERLPDDRGRDEYVPGADGRRRPGLAEARMSPNPGWKCPTRNVRTKGVAGTSASGTGARTEVEGDREDV
ncbi:MAG TPA: hypothetical protein PLC21_14980, partial [Deltaproteobacteria bacterium]|nr:hypothetical protein [Deltaproteobacteria bacterium]